MTTWQLNPQELEISMDIQRALEDGEIIFFVQPKCNVYTGKIVGGEALVRWKHKEKGLISPGVFIPVLEKTGELTKLDQYIWEQVCIWQRGLLDRGIRPVPVSVNVSNLDIQNMNVPDYFCSLAQKYELSPALIEIEITETTYAKDYSIVIETVQRLHEAGFKVLMDDFGSGYSSLNMLQNIDIDVLKLDMRFLNIQHEKMKKSVRILESVINMAQTIGLPMIAEGVEAQEHINALKDMGCNYAQGYYFFRPMAVEDMERLLVDEAMMDYQGVQARQLEQVHMSEFLNENMFNDTMVNNILGAVLFFRMEGENVEVLRVNEQFYRMLGIEASDEGFRSHIQDYIYEKDRAEFFHTLEHAERDQMKGAECDLRYFTPDKTFIWLNVRCFYLHNREGAKTFYCSLRDVTEQHRQEQRLEGVLELSRLNAWDWNLKKRIVKIRSGNEDEVPIFLRGRRSNLVIRHYPECVFAHQMIGKGYEEIFRSHVENIIQGKERRNFVLEIPFCVEGHTEWIEIRGETEQNEQNETVRAFGSYRNITDKKRSFAEEKEKIDIWKILENCALYSVEANITRNELAHSEESREWCRKTGCREMCYSEAMNYIEKHLIQKDYQEKYQKFTDRERLLNHPCGEIGMENMEILSWYQEKYHYMQLIQYLREDAETGDIYLKRYVINIGEKEKENSEIREENDCLTGMLKKEAGISKMEAYLKENPDIVCGAVMFDIENFGEINKKYGHTYGDVILRSVAYEIQRNIRRQDLTAYLGGDRILVLCKGISASGLSKIVNNILQSLVRIYGVPGRETEFSVSAGCAMLPEHGRSMKEIREKVTAALMAAKLGGRNSFEMYRDSMDVLKGMSIPFEIQAVLGEMAGGFLIYRADAGEEILYVSEAVLNLYKCADIQEFRELTGSSFRGMVHPDDYIRVSREIESQIQASDNNTDFVEYRIIQKDGEICLVHDYGYLMKRDGEADVFYVFMADAEQRKMRWLSDVVKLRK